MDWLTIYYIKTAFRFAVPLFIFSVALVVHMPRRKNFLIRVLVALAGYFTLTWFSKDLINATWLRYSWLRFYFILYVVATIVCIFLCFKVSIQLAIFFAISGYLLQHSFDRLFYLFQTEIIYRQNHIILNDFQYYTLYGALLVVMLVGTYFFFTRRTKKERFDAINERITNFLFYILIILSFSIVYVFSCFMMFDQKSDTLVSKIYAIILCIILLFTQYGVFDIDILARDRKTLQSVIETNQKQQLAMEENINFINMKMHDLKHIYEKMDEDLKNQEYMSEFRSIVSDYDNVIAYKNEALRSILMEKTIQCKKANINFTFLVDEKNINFISKPDLMSILGNALNNAYEAAIKVTEGQNRFINLDISTHGSLLQIHVENSHIGDIKVEDNKIVSSKSDTQNHGFGLKSIFYITEKYGGVYSYKAGKEAFYLNLLFPIK